MVIKFDKELREEIEREVKDKYDYVCCICGEKLLGCGNNAMPLEEGVCCDLCNLRVVDERIRRLKW